MGNIKVGDLIIVTDELLIGNYLIGTVQKVQEIDHHAFPYNLPFKVVLSNGDSNWVDGIPHSPLMMELL